LQRVLSTATLVGLLVATAAAFAITEKLKLVRSPVTDVFVTKTFSPVCRCGHAHALVQIRLRHADTATVNVLDAHGQSVRVLADAAPARRGWNTYRWNGLNDLGGLLPNGTYEVELHLARERSTIILPVPHRIALDTKAPRVVSFTVRRGTFSPDGDHQSDTARIRFRLSEEGRALLFLDGRQVLKTYWHPIAGVLSWNGAVPGRRLPPGTYTLEFGAVDPAGNVTPPSQRVALRLTIRYIKLANARIDAAAGKRFAIGVSTDAKRYMWRLGARRGVASGPLLRLRAPARPGRYTLTVTEHGRSDRAAVIVG
jgi:hypothetical protein